MINAMLGLGAMKRRQWLLGVLLRSLSMGGSVSHLNWLCEEAHKTSHTTITNPGYKTLLLGCGHVGKSTIFKQLINVHGGGFQDDEFNSASKHIQDSIVVSMKNLLNLFKSPENDQFITDLPLELLEMAKAVSNLSPEQPLSAVADEIQQLRNHQMIKNAYYTGGVGNHGTRNLGNSPSAEFFFEDFARFRASDYRPTGEDIIKAYIPTTGMRERKFTIKGTVLNVFDTGGQRSERNKWIHCFDAVHCLIYVASLDHWEYNLYEENDLNAMMEQIDLFDALVNNRYFKSSYIVLLLNFSDLLHQKIVEQGKSISVCFDDYDDWKNEDGTQYESEYAKSIDFITHKFKSKMPAKQRLYTHVTCAIDKNNIKKVFDDITYLMKTSMFNPSYTTVHWNAEPQDLCQELKIHFVALLFGITGICCIFVFVPYYALSYLQMAIVGLGTIFSWAVIPILCGNEGASFMISSESIPIWIGVIFMNALGALHSVQVTFFRLNNETQDDYKWIVFMLFPLCLLVVYFIFTSSVFYYFYWHQSWLVFWYGLMFIVVSMTRDIVQYVNMGLLIIGIFLMTISFAFPFIAYCYFRKQQKVRVYHKLGAVSLEM